MYTLTIHAQSSINEPIVVSLLFIGLKKTLEEQKGRLKAELNVAQVKVRPRPLDDCTTDTTG
jgi:hypothetical protein